MNRKLSDYVVGKVSKVVLIGASLIVFIVAFALVLKSIPIVTIQPLSDLFLTSSWRPIRGEFGLYAFIIGTLCVTGLSMVLAIPICLLSAIYLAEYAPIKIRATLKPLIDLLAGIPSVVYGLWGILFVVPLVRDHIAPLLDISVTGFSVLAGGIVLAIMVAPIIISLSEEVFRTVSVGIHEASLALGATKWQTVKHVVIRKALPGIIAAIILGFSRAFGETMAVLMVIGNTVKVPLSIFDPASTLPSLIANNYGEIMSVPLFESVILFAALILLLVITFFNVIARMVLQRIEQRAA